MKTGEIIAELRGEKGMKQAELGKLLHCSDSTISAHEKGDREISLDALKRYAEVFNVSTDYLLGLTEVRFPAGVLDQIFASGVPYSHLLQELYALTPKQRKALLVILEDMYLSAQITEHTNKNM